MFLISQMKVFIYYLFIFQEALRDDIRDIKLNQQRNDRTLQEEANMWRAHTEQLLNGQGNRHLHDVSRLQDMLMKMIVGFSTASVDQTQQVFAPTAQTQQVSAPTAQTQQVSTTAQTQQVSTTAQTQQVSLLLLKLRFIPIAQITLSPTVTAPASTNTTTTFGTTTTVPFGGSLFGGGANAGTNVFNNFK
jgi:hypothetical protein